MGYLLTLCAASQRQPGSDKNPKSPHCVQEQAAALHAVGMLDYCQLKDRILIATAALVAAGVLPVLCCGRLGGHRAFLHGRLWLPFCTSACCRPMLTPWEAPSTPGYAQAGRSPSENVVIVMLVKQGDFIVLLC